MCRLSNIMNMFRNLSVGDLTKSSQARGESRYLNLLVKAVALSLLIPVVLTPSFASASESKGGVGGGASIGDTLVATAWEKYISTFTVTDTDSPPSPDSPWTATTPDIYSYRITNGEGVVKDFQPTTGLDGLTAEEQTQWYVDDHPDGAAYEFDWYVFGCSDDTSAGSQQSARGIVLDEVPYRDVTSADGWENFTMGEFIAWTGGSPRSLFSDYDSRPNPNLTTNVRADLISDQVGGDDYPEPLLAASYLDFSCPAGLDIFIGRVLDGVGGDPAVAKTLPVDAVMSAEIFGGEVTVDMADTYVAVTGGGYPPSNFALWGVSYINASVSPPSVSSDSSSDRDEQRASAPAIHLDLQAEVGDAISGAPVVIGGQGLAGGSNYTLIVRSDPQVVDSGTASPLGNFSKRVFMPALSPGSHTLTLTATAPDGSSLSLVQPFTVGANGLVTSLSPTTGSMTAALAATGLEGTAVFGVAGVAVVLVLAGVLMVASARGRNRVAH
jgi:hypothetical protein